jgi:TonB family protein
MGAVGMRGWIIGVCGLVTAEAAQAQNGRLALECSGTRRVQDINLEDPASNSERTQPRKIVFIIDEASGKIITYSSALARYVEFCRECKKDWSATAVSWSDDHTEIQYDRLSYKSTEEGQIDWKEGTAYGKSFMSHYRGGEKETGQTKEHADYPRCVKVDVDTYDFESLSSSLQEQVAAAAPKKPAPRPAPPRQDLSVQSLSDGAELRYLPLAIARNDYPPTAERAGVQGTSIVRLQVDTSGLVGCTTARSSGSPILDQQACRLYRERGLFELRGTTQPVTFQAKVEWALMD